MLVFVLAVAAAILFSFLCSVAEAVLLSISHAQIEKLGKKRAAEILRRFKRDVEVPITAILTLATLAHTTGASIAGASYQSVFDPRTLWIFSLTFTAAILLLTEIVPKTLGVVFVEKLAVPVAYAVDVLVWVLKPVTVVARWIAAPLRRGPRRPVTSLEEIRLLAALGRSQGAVGIRTAEIIEGAASLRELTAYDVMVPRNGVRVLSGERSLEQNLQVIRRTGHSRFPYTPNGDLDRIEGVVLVKDLLFQLHESPGEPTGTLSWCRRSWSPPRCPWIVCFACSRRSAGTWEWWSTSTAARRASLRWKTCWKSWWARSRTRATASTPPSSSTGRQSRLSWMGRDASGIRATGSGRGSRDRELGGFVANLLERVPRVGDRVFSCWLRVSGAAGERATGRAGRSPPPYPFQSTPFQSTPLQDAPPTLTRGPVAERGSSDPPSRSPGLTSEQPSSRRVVPVHGGASPMEDKQKSKTSSSPSPASKRSSVAAPSCGSSRGNHPRDVPVVPTGSLGLDIALGIGGYPRGA